MENTLFYEIIIELKIYYSMKLLLSGTCNYRNFARGKQVINW